MKDLNTILSSLNLLGLGGMGVFIFYLVKGLMERISSLTLLAEEQKKTLDAVRDRASETDKLSQSYKKALADFQDMGEKIEKRRRELIEEQERAIKRKDDELAKLASLQIQELELKEESLKRIPQLEKQLEEAVLELRKQLTIVIPDDFTIQAPRGSFALENNQLKPLVVVGEAASGKSTFINQILTTYLSKGDYAISNVLNLNEKSGYDDKD
jgi:uncharacterized membrane protein YccC